MHYITFDNAKTYITNIDDIYKIENPHNVKKLYLSNNKLTSLPDNIFNSLTQLQTLRLYDNNLTSLPENIFNSLIRLQTLSLYSNNLSSLPENIFNSLTQLQELYLSNNNFVSLSYNIFNSLTQLQILTLYQNKLTSLPENIFNSLTQLQDLTLSSNNLSSLPENIFNSLTQLQELYLSNNKLTSLPTSIIRCNNLNYIKYSNNEINYIPPNIQRFLNNLNQQTNHLQVYNDGQNVHNHSIQESIKTSLENILNVPKTINKDNLISDLIENNYMNEHSFRLLLEYCQNTSVHSVLNITFEESLLHILEFINLELSQHKQEILKILEIELLDSVCKCFTGRISRLINSLNGFSDLVQIKIPDNMAISNVIVMIKNNYKGSDVNELKEIITKDLLNRGYSEDKINEYIDYVEI